MREKILKFLREHPEISGQTLSEHLGISRAAVGKHIQALREQGYCIEAATNRGYRFISAPDVLSAAEIGCFIAEQDANWQIQYHEELSSTTAVLRGLAEQGAPAGTVLIAEAQTAGRGRLDRGWHSPPGNGLWMSFLLRPPFAPQVAQTITLTTACGVALALDKLGFEPCIKWPNDILSTSGHKLCGIKSEMCADMDSVQWLVTGVGLNINLNGADFPPPLDNIATSLLMLGGKRLHRASVAAAVLDEIHGLYQILLAKGFAPIREIWLKYAVSLGQRVRIRDFNGEYYAIARDLDTNGHLLIERDGQTATIVSGDIFLI